MRRTLPVARSVGWQARRPRQQTVPNTEMRGVEQAHSGPLELGSGPAKRLGREWDAPHPHAWPGSQTVSPTDREVLTKVRGQTVGVGWAALAHMPRTYLALADPACSLEPVIGFLLTMTGKPAPQTLQPLRQFLGMGVSLGEEGGARLDLKWHVPSVSWSHAQAVVLRVGRELGLEPRILWVLTGLYHQLQRVFKLAGNLGGGGRPPTAFSKAAR